MIKIYNHKFKEKELEGTDMSAVSAFCKKNKIKGAVMLYEDDEGLNIVPIVFNKKGGEFVGRMLDMLWERIRKPYTRCSVQLHVDTKALQEIEAHKEPE